MSKGKKHDQGKLRMDLIPVYPLRQWTAVLTMGAAKYDDRNWERGMNWSRLYAAALRHLFAFWGGEDIDLESGLPHLAHAMCCLSFLLEYSKTFQDGDDRPHHLDMDKDKEALAILERHRKKLMGATADSKDICPKCKTFLEYAAGIGPVCPNKKCEVNDDADLHEPGPQKDEWNYWCQDFITALRHVETTVDGWNFALKQLKRMPSR